MQDLQEKCIFPTIFGERALPRLKATATNGQLRERYSQERLALGKLVIQEAYNKDEYWLWYVGETRGCQVKTICRT